MYKWNDQDFRYGTDPTTILGPATGREPDTSVRPRHRPRQTQGGPAVPAADEAGTPYPTMMVEVGYSQSTSDLHQAATLYLSK